MANTIMSLLVEIGLDSSKFKKGIKDTTGSASALGNSVNKSTAGIQASLNNTITGIVKLGAAYATAMVIFEAGQRIWTATGQKFIDYSEQVKNLSRNIGVSAEEASRLIQVADDVRVSYETMDVAMKIAQKGGMEMSIEGLAKLSDEYLKLAPGVDRAQFLLTKFGKSGMEMGKMMEMGGDAIRSASDAISKNLIITEQGLKDAEDYKRSLDGLADAWDALSMALGKVVIGPVSDAMKILTINVALLSGDLDSLTASSFPDWIQKLGMKMAGYTDAEIEAELALQDLVDTNQSATGTFEESATAIQAETDNMDLLANAAKITSDELAEITRINTELISTVESFASLTANHAESMKDAYKGVADAQADLAKAQKGGDKEDIQSATLALQEQQAAVQQLVVDYVKAGDAIVYEMIKAELAIGGLTDEETLLTLEAGKAFGVMTDADIAMAQAAITQKNAFIDAAKASGQLGAEVDAATNKIIYDMMLAKLAVDGLTDAEFQAALAAGKSLGVLSDAAIKTATDQLAATNALLAESATNPETTTATTETVAAVDSVTAAIQTSDQTQNALTTSVSLTTSAIQAEKLAVDNVILSIQLATMQQASMTLEIWKSVDAQNALNAAAATGGGTATPPPSRDSGGIGIAGQSYRIGTGAQPELFTPSTNGRFTPNAGGGGTVININNPVGETAEASINRQLKNLSYLGIAL